tara:strand:- start:64 stop:378 length:315 start_codon:yes stop_codon:yes gene_type:complete
MVQTLAEATKGIVQEKAKITPELQKKLVCEEVLEKLGTVKDFYRIDASNVYHNKWRVDVWTLIWKDGMYGPSYNIKYSYFCTVQDNCIAKSDPEIIPEKLQLRV